MPRKPRMKSSSGIYHIMVRGANKQEIFHDDEDCIKFLEVVERYKVETVMQLFGWCLMNNHVHLLLKEGNENISITMKRIGISYVAYYNRKYGTTGHLFQDRFRSEVVETDKSLLTVLRYIHQNPVKAGIVNNPGSWRWSSCHAYYSKNAQLTLDNHFILKKFSADLDAAREKFRKFNELVTKEKPPAITYERIRLTDEEAKKEIKKILGEIEIAQVKSLPKPARNKVLQEIKKVNGLTLRQAARIMGVSIALISRA